MRVDPEQELTTPGAPMSVLPADFMERYWRSQPLYLPGAAATFLPDAPSRADILAKIDSGEPYQTDGSTVWFLEGRTSGLAGVERLVSAARAWFEWHDVWCDVFLTAGRSSIGSHYDGSDNVTIQLTGNKTWFLSPPDAIHEDDRRRRVLGEPALGPATMPAAPCAFEVREGDALYIPSTWIHWGFSDGDSTSVSLVVNVATPFHALQEQILGGLRHDPRWSTPLPVGPGSAAGRTRVLTSLVEQDLPLALRDCSLRRITDRSGTHISLKGGLDVSRAAPSAELSWAVDYFGRISPQPDNHRLDDERLYELFQLRAQRNLGRLVSLCAERYPQTASDDARRIYAAVSGALRELPHTTLDALLTDPELCSWLARAEKDTALSGGRQRVEDPLAHGLGLMILPSMAPQLSAREPLTVDTSTDEDGCLTLRRAGCRLLFADRPRRVTLQLGQHGPRRLEPGAYQGPQEISALHVTSGGVTLTTAWTDWLSRVAPTGTVGAAATSVENGTDGMGRIDRVEQALRPLGPNCANAPDRPGFLPWVMLRCPAGTQVDHDPLVEVPGLPVLDADGSAAQVALGLAGARARVEFDLIAEAFPLLDEAGMAAGRRKALKGALRRAYVHARVLDPQSPPGRAVLDLGDTLEPASGLLTPWGRVLLGRM